VAEGLLAQLALAAVPLFVIVDPLAAIGLFLGLTARMTGRERRRVAGKATLFAAAVLLAFAFLGQAILRYLGIALYSLQVAGGILLTLIGLNMLKEGEEVPHAEIEAGEALPVVTGGAHPARPVAHDPSLVPLGLPMLAGPGAISLVILQGTQFDVTHATGALVVAGAVVVVLLASLAILLAAAGASRVIGENGRRVITRIMGLLTVAFAVQYVFDGVNAWLRR